MYLGILYIYLFHPCHGGTIPLQDLLPLPLPTLALKYFCQTPPSSEKPSLKTLKKFDLLRMTLVSWSSKYFFQKISFSLFFSSFETFLLVNPLLIMFFWNLFLWFLRKFLSWKICFLSFSSFFWDKFFLRHFFSPNFRTISIAPQPWFFFSFFFACWQQYAKLFVFSSIHRHLRHHHQDGEENQQNEFLIFSTRYPYWEFFPIEMAFFRAFEIISNV